MSHDHLFLFGHKYQTQLGTNTITYTNKPTTTRKNLNIDPKKPSSDNQPPIKSHPLLQFQGAAGNQAVQSIIRSHKIQTKLRINNPNDIYEQEADRLSEQVMGMSEPSIAVAPFVTSASIDHDRKVERKCQSCEDEDEKLKINRKSLAKVDDNSYITENASREIEDIRNGAGSPIDSLTRTFMQSRFGYDFNDVRVHTNGKAARSARSLNALAYTIGNDIIFDYGKYEPHTTIGKRLLAHELIHTIQNKKGSWSSATFRNKSLNSDEIETSSERMRDSDAYQMNEIMKVTEQPATIIERQPNGSVETGPTDAGPTDAGPTDAGTSNNTPIPSGKGLPLDKKFEEFELASDSDHIRSYIEQLYTREGDRGGSAGVKNFIDRLQSGIKSDRNKIDEEKKPRAGGLPEWTPDMLEQAEVTIQLKKDMLSALENEFTNLQNQMDETIADFEKIGIGITKVLLTDSETRINDEAERYGFTKEDHVETDVLSGFTMTSTEYKMADNNATRRLGNAASELLAKLKEIDRLCAEQQKYVKIMAIEPEVVTQITDQGAYDDLESRIKDAKKEYEILREDKERDFPIISQYNNEGGLAGLASGSSGQAAQVLGPVIEQKREKIKTVREGLDNGKIRIWKLPEIVEITKGVIGIQPYSIKDRAINDHKVEIESEKDWITLALSVLALALGLLAAIPTGGSSLVAAVAGVAAVADIGLSSYILYEQIHEYQLKSALSGTGFGPKARAISQEDPSLFWLALDIVGTIFAVAGEAAVMIKTSKQLFSELAPVARIASAERVSATAAHEAEDIALGEIRVKGNNVKPGLGDTIANDALKRRAHNIEQGVQEIAKEGAYKIGDHELTRISDGVYSLCSAKPCMRVDLTKEEEALLQSLDGRMKLAQQLEDYANYLAKIPTYATWKDTVLAKIEPIVDQICGQVAMELIDINLLNAGIQSPFVQLVIKKGSSMTEAGNLFHNTARRIANQLSNSGKLPQGIFLEAEKTIQEGLGGSRLDLFFEVDAQLISIDLKSTSKSALTKKTIEQQEKHLNAAAGNPDVGVLDFQQSRNWIDYVEPILRKKGLL
jgi:hypothetical protein